MVRPHAGSQVTEGYHVLARRTFGACCRGRWDRDCLQAPCGLEKPMLGACREQRWSGNLSGASRETKSFSSLVRAGGRGEHGKLAKMPSRYKPLCWEHRAWLPHASLMQSPGQWLNFMSWSPGTELKQLRWWVEGLDGAAGSPLLDLTRSCLLCLSSLCWLLAPQVPTARTWPCCAPWAMHSCILHCVCLFL